VAGSESRTWTLISLVCTRRPYSKDSRPGERSPTVMQTLARLWRETLRYFGVAPYPHERS
jgi:hypothetical protein